MDIVESDLLKQKMPSVTYLRLDGSVPASLRQNIVDTFNEDVSIDILLLSTSVGKFKMFFDFTAYRTLPYVLEC